MVIESVRKMQVPHFFHEKGRFYSVFKIILLVKNAEIESDESKEGPLSILITLDKNLEEAISREHSCTFRQKG